jgi:tetratricopeptide (TPR) repeat protein
MNLLLVAFVAVASPALVELEEQGRTHLYNLDYASARSIFGELSARAPSSPVGPYYQATTLWMEEFTRRGGMAGSTFRTGSYWDEKNRAPVEESLDRDFKALAAEAIARADAILELNPRDRDALYFRGASEGVLSAYHASLEHSYYRSYRAGKRAKHYHELLLEIDPDYADACLLPGIFEYTVATLPKTLKFAGFLMGLRGSREKGLGLVERAVENGKRSRWVARLSLSVLNQREKKYRSSLRILAELEEAFPRNPLLPFERGSVELLRKDWRGARRAFEQVSARRDAGMPNYAAIEPSLIKLKLAESYLFAKDYQKASTQLEAALELPDVPAGIRAVIFLRRGNASDGLGRRDAAQWDYRRALGLDADKMTNELAERYMKKPFS